jgi:hypothetical protein
MARRTSVDAWALVDETGRPVYLSSVRAEAVARGMVLAGTDAGMRRADRLRLMRAAGYRVVRCSCGVRLEG